MNKGIKNIILFAILLLVIVGAWQGIMVVTDVHTGQEAWDKFSNAAWIVGIIAVALIAISWILSLFKK